MIRVALVSGSRLMTEALGPALAGDPELDLVELVEGADAGFALADDCCAEAVLIDVELGEPGVIDLIRAFRADRPRCRCLVIGACEVDRIVRFIEAGALGYVCREGGFGETLRAIRAACGGESICNAAVAAAVYARIHELARVVRPGTILPADLTARERDVLALVGAGLSNKEIAARLDVAVSTAKNHVHAVLAKLEVGRRRDAALLAYRAGLTLGDSSVPGRV